MALYPYALFFHIIGVLGLFISNGLEVTAVYRMRGAKTTAQVHEWMAVNRALEKILPASAVLILASGLFMTLSAWGLDHAWITLTLSLLVVLGILGPVINGPRMKAIQQAVKAAPDGPVSGTLQKCILDPVLPVYVLIPSFMSLGAVALMVLKLDWTGSSLVIIVAFAASLIVGRLLRGSARKALSVARETSL